MKLADNVTQECTRLLHDSFSFVKPLFPKLIPVILLSWLAGITVSLVMGLLMAGLTSLGPFLGYFGTIISMLVMIVVISYFHAALFIRAYGVMSEDDVMVAETWSRAKDCYLLFALTYLLLVFGFQAIALIFVLPGMMLAAGVTATVLVSIIYILFTLCCIFFMVRLMYWIPLITLRKHRVISSIVTSFHLTKDNWWRCFNVLFLAVGLPLLAFIVLMLLLQLIFPAVLMAFLLIILGVAFMLFIPTIFCSAMLVTFNDLEKKAEGKGVQVEQSQQPAPPSE